MTFDPAPSTGGSLFDGDASEGQRTVTELIRTLRDSEKGFAEAATHVEDQAVGSRLGELAERRAQMAAELYDAAIRLGLDEKAHGSMRGALHRTWISLKAALTSGDDAIVEAAEDGEMRTLRAFADAPVTNLPSDVAGVVRRHLGELREALEELSGLRGH